MAGVGTFTPDWFLMNLTLNFCTQCSVTVFVSRFFIRSYLNNKSLQSVTPNRVTVDYFPLIALFFL